MAYAGIGSRSTPQEILAIMEAIGAKMGTLGHTLRSGGAPGADQAFQRGALSVNGPREIFLPWPGFGPSDPSNIVPSDLELLRAAQLLRSTQSAPSWFPSNLNDSALARIMAARGPGSGGPRLQARNAFQVLGRTLDDPVSRVFAWTPNAALQGGTATALRLAQSRGIPILNLAEKSLLSRIITRLAL